MLKPSTPSIEGDSEAALSDKLLVEYLRKLFSEGEFLDVVNFSQQAIENGPLNLDIVVYRACSYLILEASDMIAIREVQVESAIRQLEMIVEIMRLQKGYDESLNYYMALGMLVLGRQARADQLMSSISEILNDNPDASSYYESCKIYWHERYPIQIKEPENPPPS